MLVLMKGFCGYDDQLLGSQGAVVKCLFAFSVCFIFCVVDGNPIVCSHVILVLDIGTLPILEQIAFRMSYSESYI